MNSRNCFETLRSEIFDSLNASSGIFCTDSCGVKTSFCEFINQINNVRSQFPKKKKRIAILAEKSCIHYAAVIATVFSGNTWVPLSIETPVERLTDILAIASPDILFVSKTFPVDELAKVKKLVPSLRFLEDVTSFKGNKIAFWQKIKINDTAVIYFTSGSTGEPKGVKISFLNILTALRNIAPIFGNKKLVWGDYHDLSFVISINILFMCLCNHGTIFCANNRFDQILPNASLAANKVSCLVTVPSTLSRMRKDKQFLSIFKSLEIVASCGEPLPLDLMKEFVKRNGLNLYNFYGSTEITTWAFYHHCQYDDFKTFDSYGYVPLGKIINGNKFYISKDGLLFVSGHQVMEGYLGFPKKSHLKNFNGREWFSTGDIVEIMHGKIICKGREDNQIKLNGYRIHLMDIEAQLRKLSGVEAAICYLSAADIKSEKSEQKIVAILFTHKNFSLMNVRNKLKQFLPSYMLPRKIFCRKKLVFNKNGKIDRVGIINKLI